MKEFSNLGVLIPIYWDKNRWENGEGYEVEKYQFPTIRKYLRAQEKINFGHKKYPVEEDGSYVGYVRSLYSIQLYDETFYWNSDTFKVVFLITSPKITQTSIVGFYLTPQIDWNHARKVNCEVYDFFTYGNIRAKAEDIVRFDTYLSITKRGFPLLSKELAKNGYTYLAKEDVLKIIDEALELNPTQKDLKACVVKLKKGLS